MSEWWLVKWLLRRADGDAGYPPRAPRQPRSPRSRIPPHRCEPLPGPEHPGTVRCPICGAWDFTPEEKARRAGYVAGSATATRDDTRSAPV